MNWITSYFRIYVFGILATFMSATSVYTAWNPYVNVSSIGDSWNLVGPVLDVNTSNNGVGVWTTPSGQSALIKASSYLLGSGWGEQQIISDLSLNPYGSPAYTNQGDPDVAIDQNKPRSMVFCTAYLCTGYRWG